MSTTPGIPSRSIARRSISRDCERVNVTGNNGGDGANAAGEYDTAAISSVARANTWVWGVGWTDEAGIGENRAALVENRVRRRSDADAIRYHRALETVVAEQQNALDRMIEYADVLARLLKRSAPRG